MSDAGSTQGLRTRISSRARSTITRILRDPPPKRNDTPLNFTESIPSATSIDGNGVYSGAEDIRDQSRGPRVAQDRSDSPGPTLSIKTWLSKLRNSGKEHQAKSVTGPHGGFLTTPGQGSSGQGKERAHRLSMGSHRKVLGHLIPSGFGAILYGCGESRHDSVVGIDIMTVFPMEIVAQILSYLDHKSLLSCELVSRSWCSAALSSHVWRHTFQAEYGGLKGSRSYGRDWKSMFEVKTNLNRRWLRGQVNPTYLKGHSDSVYCVQFDQVKIITGSRDRTVRVWDIATGQCLRIIGASHDPRPSSNAIGYHKGSILCLQFDDHILVTGSSDHTCIVYSLPDFEPFLTLPGHRMGVLDVCFDESHIVSCSKDTSICVWERSTGLLLNRLRGHEGPVNAVQLRGNLVASASGDANIKLWDIESGNCMRTLSGHTRGLACIQLSEDCRTVISGGNDQSIRVWDVDSGHLRYEIRDAHKSLVRSLYLDSRNDRIISGSYDQHESGFAGAGVGFFKRDPGPGEHVPTSMISGLTCLSKQFMVRFQFGLV
ncbi:uncharacterized protein DFL_007388 [Arthrobotrys flagrans]|uniref:F-box domain-containing protein n=1 Tax=Arthrobotrys flagrans TaxID=97331 RepID=A0A436ZWD1_ARTFL|nr:hypothetical protein DFL_007388 [Arthrobotrys flagrans]